jgi:hypothetical protein
VRRTGADGSADRDDLFVASTLSTSARKSTIASVNVPVSVHVNVNGSGRQESRALPERPDTMRRS